VLHVSSDDIEPAPSFGARVNNNYIMGIAKARGTIKILLDIDQVLSPEELSGLEALGN